MFVTVRGVGNNFVVDSVQVIMLPFLGFVRIPWIFPYTECMSCSSLQIPQTYKLHVWQFSTNSSICCISYHLQQYFLPFITQYAWWPCDPLLLKLRQKFAASYGMFPKTYSVMFLVSRTNTPEIVNVLILLTTTTLSRDLHTDVWLIKPDQLALSLQQICSISINMKSPESSTASRARVPK